MASFGGRSRRGPPRTKHSTHPTRRGGARPPEPSTSKPPRPPSGELRTWRGSPVFFFFKKKKKTQMLLDNGHVTPFLLTRSHSGWQPRPSEHTKCHATALGSTRPTASVKNPQTPSPPVCFQFVGWSGNQSAPSRTHVTALMGHKPSSSGNSRRGTARGSASRPCAGACVEIHRSCAT